MEKWAASTEVPLLADNTLTMEILPWALRMFHAHDQPEATSMGRFQNIDTPVFVRHDGEVTLDNDGGIEVWVSASLLSDAWAREKNHLVDARTATRTALQQQMDRVSAAGSSKPFKIAGTSRTGRYRRLLPEYARLVMERAELT